MTSERHEFSGNHKSGSLLSDSQKLEPSPGADLGDGIHAIQNQETAPEKLDSDSGEFKEENLYPPQNGIEMHGYPAHINSLSSTTSASSIRSFLQTVTGCFSPVLSSLMPSKAIKKKLEKYEISFEDIKNLEWIGSGAH
eukprot:Sdes_comp23535_c0_seq1m21750